MEWWNNLFGTGKQLKFCEKYFPHYLTDSDIFSSPTEKEIQEIWEAETQSKESDDVEEAAQEYIKKEDIYPGDRFFARECFKAGVQWQKERSYSLNEIKYTLKEWTYQCTDGDSPRFIDYLVEKYSKK